MRRLRLARMRSRWRSAALAPPAGLLNLNHDLVSIARGLTKTVLRRHRSGSPPESGPSAALRCLRCPSTRHHQHPGVGAERHRGILPPDAPRGAEATRIQPSTPTVNRVQYPTRHRHVTTPRGGACRLRASNPDNCRTRHRAPKPAPELACHTAYFGRNLGRRCAPRCSGSRSATYTQSGPSRGETAFSLSPTSGGRCKHPLPVHEAAYLGNYWNR